ncbi:Crustacyanin-A2 subunit [Portunus trituberculatus]|uniref:Crustacyanin-A2 subunit n=1 Tax=Portunus trituberculatus TaxID=210409 RepID=A0A5B7J9C2_PORTR|nr:Crustacyanin-A2 subunit [Portunus trituberculatus]
MVSQDATITLVEPENPASMKPYLQIWAPGVPPVPYHVVKTNYRHFACVYSCYELFSLMFEVFSVLSRGPEIDNAYLAECHRAFDALELDLTRLEPVQQTGVCNAVDLEGSGEYY